MRLVGHARLQQSHASPHGVGAAAVGVKERQHYKQSKEFAIIFLYLLHSFD
jgi:hypothetical protein